MSGFILQKTKGFKNLFNSTKHTGFTLVEVMVALLIIAIVLFSLLRATAIQANHLHYLEQKNIAQWVALDTVARIQAGLIPLSNSGGNLQGEVTQLNQNWYWHVNLTSTPDPHAFQAQINISASQNTNPLASFNTYFSTSN